MLAPPRWKAGSSFGATSLETGFDSGFEVFGFFSGRSLSGLVASLTRFLFSGAMKKMGVSLSARRKPPRYFKAVCSLLSKLYDSSSRRKSSGGQGNFAR